jgi:hypothetical protein
MRNFLISTANFGASAGTKPWTLDPKSHIYTWTKPLTFQGVRKRPPVCSTVKSVATSAQIERTDTRWNPGRSEATAG